MKLKNKRGNIVTGLVSGIIGLVLLVLIGFVVIDTITGAGLLTDGGASDTAVDTMVSNYTTGIDNVSSKLPTILLIAAVVLLFGVIVVLWAQSKRMGIGSGGSL